MWYLLTVPGLVLYNGTKVYIPFCKKQRKDIFFLWNSHLN